MPESVISAGETCLDSLVGEIAAAKPSATAVFDEFTVLTYRQLWLRAGLLASRIVSEGIRCGDVVGVLAKRGPDLVVSLLAVLRAGAAFCPLEPDLPASRVHGMLADACIDLILVDPTAAKAANWLDGLGHRLLLADETRPWRPAPLPRRRGAADPAYVIFTSGSTGRPKGVRVPHRGIVTRLLWGRSALPLGEDDVVLHKTPFSFDVGIAEIFAPLIDGARLVVAAPGAHGDPEYLLSAIERAGVTSIHFVPSMLEVFLEELDQRRCPVVRRVLFSGEVLPTTLMNRALAAFPNAELVNLYGPTEASVEVTAWRCRPLPDGVTVPIGRPIDHVIARVVDGSGHPVADGGTGELYLGGPQVADGYVSNPVLTAWAFTPDPCGGPGRFYRTGDRVRQLDDGTLVFAGRIDDQVKIRGMRVELGEIESVLMEDPAVRQAAVLLRDDLGPSPRLVAYVAAAPGTTASDTKTRLRGRLPGYMVPSQIVVLDQMPLLASGKIDRSGLRSRR